MNGAIEEVWLPELRRLCGEIRAAVRARLADVAAGEAPRSDVAGVAGRGAGDVTFGIDVVAEEVVDAWLEDVAGRVGPISLLSEDAGWRHAPAGTAPFDHGGPRVALDPIDGTRNLMHDLRSAWVIVSFAPAGPGEPRFTDLTAGIASEIPDSRAALARELTAIEGRGARFAEFHVVSTSTVEGRPLRADDDGTLEAGFLPFFSYHPRARVRAQALASDVFARLASASERLDVSSIFDDQYISSGGQLVLVALGTYRGVVDARHALGEIAGDPTQTAKPYDMAGAALIAREAGCVVQSPDGSALDFPIDVTTPVDFAAYHNEATARLVAPHLASALESAARRGDA